MAKSNESVEESGDNYGHWARAIHLFLLACALPLLAFMASCGGGSSPAPPGGGGGGGGGGGVSGSAVFYVATDGSDSFSGTLSSTNAGKTDGPFKTLAKAQQAVRSEESKITGPITVEVRAGTYFLSAPLGFTSADSGNSSREITWEGYPGDAQPLISGGEQVTGWKNTSGNLWTVQLASSARNFEALYYNGQRRFRPRTTTGYLMLNPVIMSSPSTNCDDPDPAGGYRCKDRFSFNPGDLAATYHDINDVEIVGFEDWTVSRMRLASVDTSQDIAYLTGNTSGGTFFGYLSGHRYLVENAKEALKDAGQWYLDRAGSPWTLSYLANSGENPNNDSVIVPQQPQLLVANGLRYVTFKDLSFAHDDLTVPTDGHPGNPGEAITPAALSFVNSSNVTLSGVTIAHTQGWGIEFVGTAATGQGNTLTGSLLYDIGTGGVRLGQIPNKSDNDGSVSQDNMLSNNMIAAGGRFLPGGEGTGIWIGSSHHDTVSHNDVHDFYNGAIELGQSPSGETTYTHDDLIEDNMLYDLGQGVTSDMGCVHVASSDNTGNKITGNVCHDVTQDQTAVGYGGNGMYLDSATKNVTVENNLVYRVSDTALFVSNRAGGNVIKNNIFALGREGMIRRGPAPTNGGGFMATQNVFYYDVGPLQRIPADWYCGGSCTSQFVMDSNIYWNASGKTPTFITTVANQPDMIASDYTLAQWQAATGEDVHSKIENPDLVSPAYPTDNFSLMSSSPAISAVGFSPFSTSQVGPSGEPQMPGSVPQAFPRQLLDPATDF